MSDGAVGLGSILKRIGNYGKMETFTDRLRFQKKVYLMQAFGLNLGYRFSWYIRGPYSPSLTIDGFELRSYYDGIPEGRFVGQKHEDRFQEYLQFLADKRHDEDWLEIIASIHFLRRVHPGWPKNRILEKVQKKQSYFTKEMCEGGWQYLEEWDLI